MIPMILAVKVAPSDGRIIRVWIPLFLIWLLLLPLAIVLAPIALIVALVLGCDVWRGTRAIFGVFTGLSGTHVEVDAPDAYVRVHIQ